MPLSDIIRKHGLSFHQYADDTQVYLSCDPSELDSAMQRIELCITDIKEWMATHCLCLNDDKTELIIFGSKAKAPKAGVMSLSIGSQTIHSSAVVRNLGSVMDVHMNLKSHVNAVCKGAWYCLQKVG